MSVLVSAFVAEYPECSGLPEPALERRLKQAALMLDPGAWGKCNALARHLWAAHHLALEYDLAEACARTGARSPYDTGVVTSMTAGTGSLSLNMAPGSLLTGDDPVAAGFARTRYGLEFLGLLRTVVSPGTVVYSADTSGSMQR